MPTTRTILPRRCRRQDLRTRGLHDPVTQNVVYDPATTLWSSRASVPSARFSTAWASVAGEIYLIGVTWFGHSRRFLAVRSENGRMGRRSHAPRRLVTGAVAAPSAAHSL